MSGLNAGGRVLLACMVASRVSLLVRSELVLRAL